MKKSLRKGQETFEYVLLLAGVLLIVVLAIVLLRGGIFSAGTKDVQLQACARSLAQTPYCYDPSGKINLAATLPAPLPQTCQSYKDEYAPPSLAEQFNTCGDVFGGIVETKSGGAPPVVEPTLKASEVPNSTEIIVSKVGACEQLAESGGKGDVARLKHLSDCALALKDEATKETGDMRQQTIDSLLQTLKERKSVLENVLESDSFSTFFSLYPDSVISTMPVEAQDYVEKLVDLEAKIDVITYDDFENKNAWNEYFLTSGGERLKFYPIGLLPPVTSGSTVRVKGFRVGGAVIASVDSASFQVLSTLSPLPYETVGEQKTLVVLIKFLDSPSQVPFTPEQAQQIVFGRQMQAFYKEASYDQIWWTGKTIGWYTLPRNWNYEFPNFAGDYPSDEVYNLIKNDVDVRQYQRLVMLVFINPHVSGGMSTVGKMEVPLDGIPHAISVATISLGDWNLSRGKPFSWTLLDFILSHELGHSLGVGHASTWECGPNKILYGQCESFPYGSLYDVMADGASSLHFNALLKDSFHWLETSVLTITQSGVYTINPLELRRGMHAAKVWNPMINYAPFYLEYRQGIGFDAALNATEYQINQHGLFVNWLAAFWFPSSLLLDMSPESTSMSDWFNVVLLSYPDSTSKILPTPIPPGAVFNDLGRGITIGPVLTANKTGITFVVQISKPTCIRNNPSAFMSPSGAVVPPGGSIFSSILIQNFDSPTCSSSNLQASVVKLPAGWTYILGNPDPVLLESDGDYSFNALEIDVPADAAPGQYVVTVRVTNLDSGYATDRNVSIDVVTPSP